MRLLDVGCGWGGMVRHAAEHYGVQVLGVTLSREQAAVGPGAHQGRGPRPPGRGPAPRLPGRARARVRRGELHRADRAHRRQELPGVLPFLRARLRPGGRLLNHGITRPDNKHAGLPRRGFIGRYVFPDGELTGSGDIVTAMEDSGLEVQHQENLRVHYARTLKALVRRTSSSTGTSASPRPGSRPPRSGASTWPAPGSRSSATGSSCTRCSPPAPRPTARSGYPLRHDFGV